MTVFKSKTLLKNVVIVLVIIIGITTILVSHADAPAVSVEPENGTLAGNIAVRDDSSASGGKAVIFQAPDVPYGPSPISTPTTPFVTPDQYGAIGDGVHDDFMAIQAALDNGVGKTVWLPANKTYLSSKMIAVSSNTTVLGAGTTSILRFPWSEDNAPNSGGGSYLRNRTTNGKASNISLRNFKIVGSADGLPTGVTSTIAQTGAISLNNINNLTLSRLEVTNTGGLGIGILTSQNITISQNYVHNVGRGGIDLFKHAGSELSNILIEKNHIAKTGDDSIGINGLVPDQAIDGLATNVTIQDNQIDGWPTPPNDGGQGRGILLNGVDGATVTRNNIYYSGGVNILLQGCTKDNCNSTPTDWHNRNLTVTNNHLSRPASEMKAGILIMKTDTTVISGNTFLYNKPLILNEGCTSCTIQAQ